MTVANFDEQFRQLYTGMVEIAFEYVNRNTNEVDAVFVYASMEEGTLYFNVFYKINGKMVESHKVNTVSNDQYDASDETGFKLLHMGVEFLEKIRKLFEDDNREVPTLMKMIYHPKTGKFNNDIRYDLQYSNHPTRTNMDCFDDWYIEMGGVL